MNTNAKDMDLIVPNSEEIFKNNFKSMFYYMNAKKDSITKIFPKEVIIKIDDIMELNSLIIEKLKNHNVETLIVNSTINFEDRKSIEFGSWSEFEKHKWNEKGAINSLVVSWKFNVRKPSHEIPQAYTLMVKMTDSIRPEEMLNLIVTGKVEDIEEITQEGYPIVARVDFIDRLLGDELLNIVAEWSSSLRQVIKSKTAFMIF